MSAQRPPVPRQKMSGALFIAGAVIGLVGNALHPHTADPDAAATVQAIAQNGAWVSIHLAIIVAILLIIGGLVGLAELLKGTAGGPLARLGVAAALLGGAVVTVSTAIDGFVMKALAVSSAGASAPEADMAMRISIAVKEVDFGIWSTGMLVFFGAAFLCFGIAVFASRRFPGWIGPIAVVGAGGSAVAALIQIAATVEVQAAETIFLISSVLLTLWTLSVGVLLWRGRADALANEPLLAATVSDHRP
ncbi:MAG: DUF4386 family protein [Candidatus Limnocylindrales bacterium]|nr:DUF4386 family protein [Candidatus Limnocylindrales bacterium]